MSNDSGKRVEITEEIIEEFVESYIHPSYDEDDLIRTKRKDVRSAFVEWLHREHGRYDKDISNATAADLYGAVLERGAPYTDEAIDADGDTVFVGTYLSDPERPVVRSPRTNKATQERPLANKPVGQWTSHDLTVHAQHIFEKIHAFEQENSSLADFLGDIVVDILIHSIVRSQLSTQGVYLSLNTLRDELRECIEEVVEEHVEFQSDELKRRFDRVLARHAKSIEDINSWRDRFGQ